MRVKNKMRRELTTSPKLVFFRRIKMTTTDRMWNCMSVEMNQVDPTHFKQISYNNLLMDLISNHFCAINEVMNEE